MSLIKKFNEEWTMFEKVWIVVFSLINLYLFFAMKDSLLGLVSSLSGMLCVVLVAKGKISNYYFGVIQTLTYGYLSYTYGLYGESMLNLMFYFPLQFVGLYFWRKNQLNKDTKQHEDIYVKRLNVKQWVMLAVISVIAILCYTELLNVLKANLTGIDSFTVVLSVIAQILMVKRYAEQWVFWILVNVSAIILWYIALGTSEANNYNILIMWVAFLFNSVYGYIKWLKMVKTQQDN